LLARLSPQESDLLPHPIGLQQSSWNLSEIQRKVLAMNHVVITTTDSNTWGGASSHGYPFTRRPDGLTDIDLVVVRDGKNLKGCVLGFVLRAIGRGVLEKAFENSVKAIEARNSTLKEGAIRL
jgi:hypothetical protein